MFTFSKSFEELRNEDPTLTREQWSADAKAALERMKRSPHWHGGIPCLNVSTCDRYKESHS